MQCSWPCLKAHLATTRTTSANLAVIISSTTMKSGQVSGSACRSASWWRAMSRRRAWASGSRWMGDIERHPDEFPVLLLIGQLFLELQTYNAVAMELNRRKIRTPEGGPFWSSRSVSNILQSQVYRGKVIRGRMTSQDKGGTLTKVSAAPDKIRVYERASLQVWPTETVAKIDALVSVRSTTRSRGVKERKHLSSSAVSCSHCGGSIAITCGAKKKYPSYTCANARAGGCRTLGYRPEHVVDANVIMACGMLLTDEVLSRTKDIIRQTLDATAKLEARAVEQGRLERDVERAEKRVRNLSEALAESDTREARAHVLAVLGGEQKRLAELQEAQRTFKAGPALEDPKTVLAALDARVDALRHGLRQGGLAALPAVQDCLSDGRLKATRRADGRWDLEGEADPIRVFYGETRVVSVGKKQKATVSGDVVGVTITPVTSAAKLPTGTSTPIPATPPAPVTTSSNAVATPSVPVTQSAPTPAVPATSGGAAPATGAAAHP